MNVRLGNYMTSLDYDMSDKLLVGEAAGDGDNAFVAVKLVHRPWDGSAAPSNLAAFF